MYRKYDNERIYRHPNPIIRFVERRRVAAVLSQLRTRPDHKVLGAGSGEAYIERQIRARLVAALDLSEEAVHRAATNTHSIPRLHVVRGNVERLPFADHQFDKILCSEVIEHVLHPRLMLAEFNRVLKPDGKLVLSFPNEPLINFLKRLLLKLGLFEPFFPDVPADMTEEWHLRSFDLSRFHEVAYPEWEIERITGVPSRLLPIRYVVTCRRQ